ncbi:putative Proteasome subunit beta type-7 [Paratrimastix pyriformis]|uniref:Proteasome subunit beta type-7 n=1 Tax=Paratrimastix pyriformis TaxID=342808 RepID=A0ABQ8V282_9EUKA|nr:putative Proteasome subunit beta type-7 [Paratrimastix pyriformis]
MVGANGESRYAPAPPKPSDPDGFCFHSPHPEVFSGQARHHHRHSHQNMASLKLQPADQKVLPKAKKTGTTICGLICHREGCVVLGADTRATSEAIIADKNCSKIHYLAPNIYCCGAGTAADTEHVTQLISSNLKLLRLNSGRQSRVDVACVLLKRHLFPYQGYVSAALVLGGVDFTGPHIYQVWPHGSTDSLDYVTMGSGSMAAMSMFESRYSHDLTLDQCKDLVHDAVLAGIFNDEGSGSNVDITIIERNKPAQILRNMDTPNTRLHPMRFQMPLKNTVVLREFIELHEAAPVAPAAVPAPAKKAEDEERAAMPLE